MRRRCTLPLQTTCILWRGRAAPASTFSTRGWRSINTPSDNIAVGSKKPSRRSLLLRQLAEQPPPVLDGETFASLKAAYKLSDNYLRKALRASGIPMTPLVEGVRQESFADLERTLLALGSEYARPDRERRMLCRRLVITAKEHARWAARKGSEDIQRNKEEMVLWMLTWLENPGIFAEWVKLRKRAREGGR